jgi:hypothetical protein
MVVGYNIQTLKLAILLCLFPAIRNLAYKHTKKASKLVLLDFHWILLHDRISQEHLGTFVAG